MFFGVAREGEGDDDDGGREIEISNNIIIL
jgi:hypothetical protein